MSKDLRNSFSIEIAIHCLFWLFYFAFPVLKFGEQHWFHFDAVSAITNTLFLAVTVYTVLFVLKRRIKNPLYLIGILMVFLVLIYLNCHITGRNCNCNFRACFMNKTVEFFLINSFFVAIVTLRKNLVNKQILERTKQEKAAAELKSLKAQLNPHFLFNTLNMLYSRALDKDGPLADKILKLSDGLHYLMHEGDKTEVPIRKEIEFINGYIALQKARLGEKIAVDFIDEISDMDRPIPPLLIIPLVENAFKYASMVAGNGVPLKIHIKLKGNQLHLNVENSFDPTPTESETNGWKKSGIGIQNLKRRLQLLYPDHHELTLLSENERFVAILKIDLL